MDERSKTDYFDSMYHAAAVVGLNTSAMIEAAIVGRPVHTVLLPEFSDNQEGTLHFHYLLDGPNALLRATRSLDDHAGDLADILEGRDPDPTRSARFVSAFVRPRGIDIPGRPAWLTNWRPWAQALLRYQFRCRFWCELMGPLIRRLLQALREGCGRADPSRSGGSAAAGRAAAARTPPIQRTDAHRVSATTSGRAPSSQAGSGAGNRRSRRSSYLIVVGNVLNIIDSFQTFSP